MTQVPPYRSEVVREETTVGGTPVVQEPVGAPVLVPAGRPVAYETVQPVAEPLAPVAPAGYTRVTRSSSVVGNPGAWRATQIVWYILAVIEIIIGLRVLLLALGANPSAGFTRFIHDLSAPFVAPFRAMFSDYALGTTGVLEVGSLVGMLIWALFAWLVVKLIDIMSTPRGTRIV